MHKTIAYLTFWNTIIPVKFGDVYKIKVNNKPCTMTITYWAWFGKIFNVKQVIK